MSMMGDLAHLLAHLHPLVLHLLLRRNDLLLGILLLHLHGRKGRAARVEDLVAVQAHAVPRRHLLLSLLINLLLPLLLLLLLVLVVLWLLRRHGVLLVGVVVEELLLLMVMLRLGLLGLLHRLSSAVELPRHRRSARTIARVETLVMLLLLHMMMALLGALLLRRMDVLLVLVLVLVLLVMIAGLGRVHVSVLRLSREGGGLPRGQRASVLHVTVSASDDGPAGGETRRRCSAAAALLLRLLLLLLREGVEMSRPAVDHASIARPASSVVGACARAWRSPSVRKRGKGFRGKTLLGTLARLASRRIGRVRAAPGLEVAVVSCLVVSCRAAV